MFITLFLLSAFFSRPLISQEKDSLRIGVTDASPFVILDSQSVSGLCPDLWRLLSDSINVVYSYEIFDNYNHLMQAIEKGIVDFTINPLSITDARLHKYQLSIPFYTSRMGIAEKSSHEMPLFSALGNLMNLQTLKLTMAIILFVLVFAVLIWFAERRVNHREFRKSHKGILDGVWWAFVTMTTVGYGDKVPKSRMGRVLTIIWMLYAIAVFFVFSELTVTKLRYGINSMDDLRNLKVGTMESTGYSDMLRINHIYYIPYYSIDSALEAVRKGEIRAFVNDRESLQYLFMKYNLGKDLRLYSCDIHEQYFCWGANRSESGLIDRINPVLINLVESVEWIKIQDSYGIRQ
jgi:polar amino acid transport system substrate-binding protein